MGERPPFGQGYSNAERAVKSIYEATSELTIAANDKAGSSDLLDKAIAENLRYTAEKIKSHINILRRNIQIAEEKAEKRDHILKDISQKANHVAAMFGTESKYHQAYLRLGVLYKDGASLEK